MEAAAPASAPPAPLAPEAKRATLREALRSAAPVLVAYSGGVDSAYLLAEAVAAAGDRALGVIADSPSLPRAALADALVLAGSIGARVEIVRTRELENPAYASNPVNRCYFCKAELFAALETMARERGFRSLAYGENADDMRQVRPGRKAAEEFAVLAPLRDAGLTKAEIRAFSRAMGLPTADAPAQPCLSSRIPHGTPVTPETLLMIERAEGAVRSEGFRVLRVRHLAGEGKLPAALVQVGQDELPALSAAEARIRDALHKVGYGEVRLDPLGYRSGI